MDRKIILAVAATGGWDRGRPSFPIDPEPARERNTKTPRRSFQPKGVRATLLGATLGGLLLISLGGCLRSASIHRMEEDVHASKDFTVNVEQVRVRMRGLVEPLSEIIVACADRIRDTSPDRAIQREALLFKIQAVPALREALFRPNPYNAILDSWVLSLQLSTYFETGRGSVALGDAAPVAAASCRYLASEIERVVAPMTHSGDVSDIRAFAGTWAAENPIDQSIAGRESTVSLVTTSQLQETFSTMEVAGSLAVSTDDLTRRLDVYSVQLLNESRWQAELLVMDMMRRYQTDEIFLLAENAIASAEAATATANRLLPHLEAALATAESAPEVIAGERAAAIDALAQELSRTLYFIRDERIAALAYLTREREATLTELPQLIEKERQRMSADMERISQNVVDHAFLRAAQLAAGVLFVLLIGLLLLLFAIRRMLKGAHREAF